MKFSWLKESSSLFVRNSELGHLLELFLISAVSSILIIRFFLELTGYPQLGGEGLHIAHVLWGGLFMVVALLVLMAFLNKEAKQVAAILGGIGFGTFIDELGKFLTSDNNYFYQPTIALIYVMFIGLFLLYRTVEKYKKLTVKEYEVNALEMLKEVIANDFDEKEKKRILLFLEKSDSEEEAILELKKLVAGLDAIAPTEKPFSSRIKNKVRRFYLHLLERTGFEWFVMGFFILASLLNFWLALYLLPQYASLTFAEMGQLTFSLVSGILFVLGVIEFTRSRAAGYQWFKKSVLVSIFLTQFFVFFNDQLSALVGLVVNLIVLSVLQYLIEEEHLEKRS